MELFQPIAEKIAAHLIERGETIAIAESSTGGLVAASLLAISGASAYFAGGAVVYTKASRMALLNIGDADMSGLRPATEAYSLLIARRVRERHGATWGFGETGASGPTGNRYGDPPGHTCMAVAGSIERAFTPAYRQRGQAGEYGRFRPPCTGIYLRNDIWLSGLFTPWPGVAAASLQCHSTARRRGRPSPRALSRAARR